MTGKPRHGMSKTPMYRAWCNMRQRVTNVRCYPTYADVGCDERWLTFEGFLDNPPHGRPYEPGLCLGRYGDLGDYSPENARWITRQENCAEQRRPQPKKECVNGHEYTPENSQLGVDGRIRCRECHRIASLRWYHRNKGGVPSVAG